jgi:Xaa-Pro aminopeptidase
MAQEIIADTPPAGLIEAQRLAIRLAETIAADARPGETEIEVRDRADRYVREFGGTGLWTPTTIGFGIGTLSCFPTDRPSTRQLWNLDLGTIDIHPVTKDGWWGDCTRTFQRGDNVAQRQALQTVERIHDAVLAAVKPGMRACDLFGVFKAELDKTPYLLLDRLSNIGHSLSAHSSYDAGYIDAWNATPMTGAWAIEPFIGNHLYGVKKEDVVWFGPKACTVIR